MSNDNWREKFDFGVVLATCALLVTLPIAGLMLNEYAKVHLSYATYQQNAENDRQATSNEISKTCFGRESIAFSECITEKLATYYKQQATNQDLQAQQDMAYWAKALFFLGILQFAFSTAGIFFIWRSLALNRDAVNAAVEGNAHALEANTQQRTSTERELRAYVSVAPNGINPTKVRDAVIGHVVVKNVGQVIAQEVTVTVNMQILLGKQHTLFRASTVNNQAIGSMHPNVEIILGSYEIISNKERPTVSNVTKDATQREYIYVWGRVSYTDGFENPRWTDFCFRYDTDNWAKEGVPKEKARYQPLANTAT